MRVSIGVDSHKGSLAAAGVDELGRVLGVKEFPNDPAGHLALLEWARCYGEPRMIGGRGVGSLRRGALPNPLLVRRTGARGACDAHLQGAPTQGVAGQV